VALADRPGHGQDGFTGTLGYGNGVASLTNGQFRLGSSQYRLTGQFLPGQEGQMAGQMAGQIAVDRGNLQDLWTAVDWIQQSGALAAAFPSAISLPDLAALQGEFAAEVAVQGSQKAGFSAAFNVSGQDWNWQQYGIQQIAAKGQISPKQLDLSSLQLQGLNYISDAGRQQFDTRLSLVGQYSAEHQSGKLQIDKVPVTAIKQWLNSSLPIEGEINATANITGYAAAPEVEGQVQLNQLRFQTIQLPATQLNYAYRGDRLSIGSPSPQFLSVQPADLNTETVEGAKKIYFAVGPIDFTLPVRALKTYVDTGELTSPLGFYAQFLSDQSMQNARSFLHKPLDISHVNVSEVLNSPTGEAWLTWFGNLIQTQSGENGKASIQSAIIAAAAHNPDGVTIMDVLYHYPVQKIRINTSAVRTLMSAKPAEH